MVKGGRAKVVGVCMSRDISNPPVLLHVIKQSVQSVWDSTVSKGGRTDGASQRPSILSTFNGTGKTSDVPAK